MGAAGMKKKSRIKYSLLLIGIIFTFVVVPIIIFTSPRSEEDFFYRNLEKLSYQRGKMQLSLKSLEVQKDKDCTYYINENDDLLCRKEGSEEILAEDVSAFIVDGNVIYYSCPDKDGIYCREIGSQEETQVLKEDIDWFAIGEDTNIVFTWKNKLYQYDKEWNKIKEFNIKKQYGDEIFYDVLYEDGHLVFESYEDELYAYSIENNEMSRLEAPINAKNNYLRTDIIKTGIGLCYLTCAYDNPDLIARYTRTDCEENGIYQLDVKKGKFTKISDECGFYLWYIDRKLYVQEKYFFGLYSSMRECEISVPEYSEKAVPEKARVWKTSGGIQYSLSEKGVLTIQGEGVLDDKNSSDTWWRERDNIKEIIIKEGITEIGKECFADYDSVESVELPKSLKKIGREAFRDCSSLKEIDLPDGVTEIGKKAFANCESIKEFLLPRGLEEYSPDAILRCYALQKVENASSYSWALCIKHMEGTWHCDGKEVTDVLPGKSATITSKTYPIQYDLNGGVATGKLPTVYPAREGITLPPNVKRGDYTFLGWGVNGDVRDTIFSGETGIKRARALWIHFRLKALKGGKIRALYDLDVYPDIITGEEVYSCMIRYSQNEDMSDCVYMTENGETIDTITGLEKGKPYYVEYAVYDDLDDYETLGDLPWRGKQCIMAR